MRIPQKFAGWNTEVYWERRAGWDALRFSFHDEFHPEAKREITLSMPEVRALIDLFAGDV